MHTFGHYLSLFQDGYRLDAEMANRFCAVGDLARCQEGRDEGYGNMQLVAWFKRTGRIEAASDPRGEGAAVVR